MTAIPEGVGLIYEQIPKIMLDLKPVGKGQYNQQQRFKYRGIDDVYNALQPLLAKHGVFSTSEIVSRDRREVQTKAGARAYHCVNSYKFTFWASDGSSIDIWADGEAMDMGDKASNKCAAIAHKYALLQLFCIPTADLADPDAESPQLSQQPGTTVQQPQQNVLANPGNQGGVSQKQLNRLFAITKSAGMRNEESVRLAQQMFGVNQLTELNREQYNGLCDRIETAPNRGQQSADNLNSKFGAGGF